MNGEVTDYTADAWLTWLVGTKGAWLSCHIGNPIIAGFLQTEVVGGSYLRQLGVWLLPPTNRSLWLNAAVTFKGMPQAVLTHVGMCDAPVNGHLLAIAALPVPLPSVPQGGTFQLAPRSFAVTIGVPA
jgi:hypothetical protein